MHANNELVMVDHLSRSQLEEQLDSLSQMSTEDLRRELIRSLRVTAESLVRLALIVRSLESRGDDLSDLKIGMMPYLRQIAYGQVLPEVVVRYAEQPGLVRAISSLPMPDQEHLSNGGKVALAIQREDGTLDHRMVDPLHMTGRQVNQVFSRGRIRPPEEQITRFDSTKPPKVVTVESVESIKIDRTRRGFVIGKRFFSQATILEALALLASPSDPANEEDDSDRGKAVAVKLTRSEHDHFSRISVESRTNFTVLTRRALRAAGLI